MLEEAEKVPPEVLHLILEKLIQPCKLKNSAAYNLACSLIRKSENNLQISVQHFLINALSSGGSGDNVLCKRHADILEAVAIADSTSLVTVWPIIMDELQSDDVEVRFRAVKLFGRILAAPGSTVAEDYGHYLDQFLRRFSDKKPEIRVEMVSWGSMFLTRNSDQGLKVAEEVVKHIYARLQDFEEKVRLASVSAVCDIAEASPRLIRVDALERVSDRMLDKKGSVRHLVMKRLASVYRTYVSRYADMDPPESDSERFDWIPAHLLKGCAHADIQHHAVEPILADLFPQRLSMERRSFFWVRALWKQDEHARRALAFLLRTKVQVRKDMQEYLTLRQKLRSSQQSQAEGDGESQGGVSEALSCSFANLGRHFPDPQKAALCMEKLHVMKDGNIFRGLSSLLKVETSATDSQAITEDILKRIGSKHPAYEWTRSLLVKIVQQPFGREHVCKLLDFVSSSVASKDKGIMSLAGSALEHLVQLACSAPNTFHGTAKKLLDLISHRNEAFVTAACKIAAHAIECSCIGAHQDKFCARLKLLCVEGTRTQAKHAALTLGKLANTTSGGQEHLKDVFLGIVSAIEDDELLDSNLPGVLSTIQIVSQQMPGLFMVHLNCIESFIVEDLLKRKLPKVKQSRGASSISTVAELQAWGLKALAKSCGRPAAPLRSKVQDGSRANFVQRVLKVLRAALSQPDVQTSRIHSSADLTHLRAAAGKAVLVIARTDHAAVTPDLFISTSLLMSDAPRDIMRKVQHGIVKHGLAQCYAVPLALAAYSSDATILKAAQESLSLIITHVRRRAANIKATAAENMPVSVDSAAISRTLLIHTAEFMMPYLIYLLANHPDLPSKEMGTIDDGSAYHPFERAIKFTIAALVNGTSGECTPAVCKMMRQLKSTVNAVNADKSYGIYVLSDIALLILHQMATQKGWDTRPYPGQVALPRAFFTLLQRPVVAEPIEVGGSVRAGDFSHLPLGFTLKPKNQLAGVKHGDNQQRRPAAAKPRSKSCAASVVRKKPTVAPSRRLPSRAARKAAIVDVVDDYPSESEGMSEAEEDEAVMQMSCGVHMEPPLGLPAPAGCNANTDREFESEREDEDEDMAVGARTDSSDLCNEIGAKMPLVECENDTIRRDSSARCYAKLSSPGKKLLIDKRKENATVSAHGFEHSTEVTRVSKQRRR